MWHGDDNRDIFIFTRRCSLYLFVIPISSPLFLFLLRVMPFCFRFARLLARHSCRIHFSSSSSSIRSHATPWHNTTRHSTSQRSIAMARREFSLDSARSRWQLEIFRSAFLFFFSSLLYSLFSFHFLYIFINSNNIYIFSLMEFIKSY